MAASLYSPGKYNVKRKARLLIFINNFLLFTFAGLTQALGEVLDEFQCGAERGRPQPPGINMVLRLPVIKLTMYLFFYMALVLNDFDGGKSVTRAIRRGQWSLKILTF
jgi:hypothetical protein